MLSYYELPEEAKAWFIDLEIRSCFQTLMQMTRNQQQAAEILHRCLNTGTAFQFDDLNEFIQKDCLKKPTNYEQAVYYSVAGVGINAISRLAGIGQPRIYAIRENPDKIRRLSSIRHIIYTNHPYIVDNLDRMLRSLNVLEGKRVRYL